MSASSDVLVIGGGIAGLTTALATADRGMHVRLVHSPRAGGASRASAGMLGPSLAGLPDHVSPIATAARDAYPAFAEGLLERAGVDISLNRSGIIEMGSESELKAAMARNAQAAPLDSRQLRELEPSLAMHNSAVLHPRDGSVDVIALMGALELVASRHPRITMLSGRVASVENSSGKPVLVRTDADDVYSAAAVVLATGAWIDITGAPAVPVRPIRGQLLTLRSRAPRHVIAGKGGYLVPGGDVVIVGATSEEPGFDAATTETGGESLRAFAASMSESLAQAPRLDHWCGLRPVSPDGLPILGPSPLSPAIQLATGYSRNGILFAPWAANLLSDALAGGPSRIPEAFLPTRFGGDAITSLDGIAG